jgi:signal transduction histidine kinase
MSSGNREPQPGKSPTAAELFQRLWDELAELVGAAATAALLRRAVKRAAVKQPELAALVLRREGLGYAWLLPAPWHELERRDAVVQLRRLVHDELHPLLRELTGPVVARRLAQAPELVEAGLAGEEVDAQGAARRAHRPPRRPAEAHPVTPLRTTSALADIAHALGSGQDAEGRICLALDALRRLVPLDRCAVVNDAAEVAPRLLVEPVLPEPDHRRLAAEAERLLATLLDHAPAAPTLVADGPPSRLAAPLVALDEIAGVLVVERDQGAYRAEDLQLLSVVASMLGAYLASLRLHAEERRATQELRDAVARRTHFLSMLSHELRNPLAPIGNALYVLGRLGPGGEREQQVRAIIVRQFRLLGRLVDDLLDVTRLVSGKVQVRRARMDLAEVVERTVEDHKALFTRSGVGLELRVADRPLWMDGDAARLAQVIGNLLTNAVKFANRGGRAEISVARAAPGTAVMCVRDDGIGIAPDVRARLFEPFAQGADTVDRNRGGLGLGLALAKGLVDLHGGTIAARSDGGGHGTEVVVSLPVLPLRAQAQTPPGELH